MIMSFGGIPLLYYGDGSALNDCTFLQDENKARTTAGCIDRASIGKKAERRHSHGSVEQRIFTGLQKMIAVRKSTPAFADYNNRTQIETGNLTCSFSCETTRSFTTTVY